MVKKNIRLVTAGLCLLFLLAGFIRALVSPETEIFYENRPAKRFPAFSPAAFLAGDYQDAAEGALADQLPQASRIKKLYNIFDAGIALPVIHALQRDGGYVGFRDVCFFDDMLAARPFALPEVSDALERSAGQISAWAEAAPEVDFYVYYIESDRDLNLETGEKSGLYEYFTGALQLPAGRTARLRLDSFQDFQRLFFKTDHHWNAEGAWQGYREICALLNAEPFPRAGVFSVADCYRGTRAAGVEGVPAEDFSVNLFDLPAMRYTVPAGGIPDYGEQARFVAGELSQISYGTVFGGDYGELLIETGKSGRRLLVMGDSYDNAILKPLAACFSECCSVDLRAYETVTGRPFEMAAYLREHDVDCVLFVGGISFYTGALSQGEGAF